MAIMYPATPPMEFPSSAERKLYRLFEQQLPDDFLVMHGVPWLDPHSHHFHLEGEADFVIAHRDLGIIILEVKGGRIELRDGQWYSIDGRDKVHFLNRSPIDQARRSMRALLDKINRSPTVRRFEKKFTFHTGIVVPNVSVGADGLGPHTPRKVIIDRTDLHSLERALRRVVSDKPPKEPLSDTAIKAFVDLVKPNEVLDEMGYADVILDSGQRIEAYTREQYEVLNLLRDQHRIAIPGCAGSGKTLLAIRKTKFLAQSGLRVLLTCYNKPLGDWLQEQVYRDREIPDHSVRVANFHRLADELLTESRIAPLRRSGNGSSNRFFSVEIPEHLFDNVGDIRERFDAVVVDEGQDFSPAMWTSLQALMTNPDYGILYVFFDAEQGIYQDRARFPVKISDIALMRNLRNTHQIHQRLIAYYSGDVLPDSSGINGLEPEVIPAPSGRRLNQLQRVFDRLFNREGIPVDDAVVLTFAGRNNSEMHEGDRFGKYVLTWKTGKRKEDQVQISTVHSFKGLERPIVIIVIEIDHIDHNLWDQLLYVGLSRAKQHLVVLGELPTPRGTFIPVYSKPSASSQPPASAPTSLLDEYEPPERVGVESDQTQQASSIPTAAQTGIPSISNQEGGFDREQPAETNGGRNEETVVDGSFREIPQSHDANPSPPEEGARHEHSEPDKSRAIVPSPPSRLARRGTDGTDLALVRIPSNAEKLLGALGYLFWFIVPIFVLATGTPSRFARVHAYQGLVFAGGAVGYYILYWIFWGFSTEAFPLLVCVLWTGFVLPILLSLYYAFVTLVRGRAAFPFLSGVTRNLFKDL